VFYCVTRNTLDSKNVTYKQFHIFYPKPTYRCKQRNVVIFVKYYFCMLTQSKIVTIEINSIPNLETRIHGKAYDILLLSFLQFKLKWSSDIEINVSGNCIPRENVSKSVFFFCNLEYLISLDIYCCKANHTTVVTQH
jgi:hypothetical protein